MNDLHPAARPTGAAVPRGLHRGSTRRWTRSSATTRTRPSSCWPTPGYPDGFEFNITVLGQPTEDQVAIQDQWKQVGVTLNFVTATSTDQLFAAVQHRPAGSSGRSRSAQQPAGFVAGVVVRRLHEHRRAPRTRRSRARSARRSVPPVTPRRQALKDLNRGHHRAAAGTSRCTRTSPTPATTPTRWPSPVLRRHEQLPRALRASQPRADRSLTGRWPRSDPRPPAPTHLRPARPPRRRRNPTCSPTSHAGWPWRSARCSPRCSSASCWCTPATAARVPSGSGSGATPAEIAAENEALGWNRPLVVQFVDYLGNLLVRSTWARR